MLVLVLVVLVVVSDGDDVGDGDSSGQFLCDNSGVKFPIFCLLWVHTHKTHTGLHRCIAGTFRMFLLDTSQQPHTHHHHTRAHHIGMVSLGSSYDNMYVHFDNFTVERV